MRSVTVLAVMLVTLWPGLWSVAGAFASGQETANLAVDELLGNTGRAAHAQRLAAFGVNGLTFPWSMWADWGKELVHNGFVAAPPGGGARSEPVSEVFTCVRCHTTAPEGPDPALANPELALAHSQEQGRKPRLTQGAGFYGLVNRSGFYAGLFAKYHRLCVPKKFGGGAFCIPKLCWPGCRKMDPAGLEDAIQVCSKYCSVGRYLEEWEMLAVLTYFWDLELKLDDLLLSSVHRQEVLAALASPRAEQPDVERVEKARRLVASRFLAQQPFTRRPVPGQAGPATGNAENGKGVFVASCGNCHKKNPAKLVENPDEFYHMVAYGSGHTIRGPYMPEYALERLSLQQQEDIRAYLESPAEPVE